MSPRILLTGIPGHYTRLIQRANGSTVVYSEKQPRPETKEDFLRELRNIGNTGNYLIGEGALGALSPNTTHIPFWHLYNCCQNGGGLDEIDSKFDICVFTCANLLRKDLSADAEAVVLSRLTMPIVMLGIGIQKREDLSSTLPEGTRNLLNVLKDHEHYFLTRGEESASFLREEGFQYVRPVGCPSVYFCAENVRLALSKINNINIGVSRTVFAGYLSRDLESLKDVNDLSSSAHQSYYVMQDEPLYSDLQIEPDASGRVYDAASGALVGKHTFNGADQLRRSLKLHAFFDTNQWRAWMSTMEFTFGRRFHGSIISLQAGVPSLIVAVDDRMREMLEYVGLPSIDAALVDGADDRAGLVAEHLSRIDASDVVERYNDRERVFRSTLAEIGVA